MDVPVRSPRLHALARAAVIAVMALVVAAPAALAAPPQHAPADLADLVLPGGDFCEHDVVLSTPTHSLHDTAFAPLPDGTERVIERGMAATRATDATTGAFLDTKGGSSLTFRFAADGSLDVTGTGWFFVWYLPGDDSDLGPGAVPHAGPGPGDVRQHGARSCLRPSAGRRSTCARRSATDPRRESKRPAGVRRAVSLMRGTR